METMYLTHPSCKLHEMGSWHPECPQRLDAISDQLLANGLMPYLGEKQAPAATREDILRVHSAYHLDRLRGLSPEHGYAEIDPDTLMNPHTLEAAYHAAGAGIAAVDAVMAGEATTAFCAVRPPGHHAEHSRAMGFCFFNNVAIAAQYAMHKHGLARIAIVDFDVHHGNGTEEAFAGDDRVLMCSFFQHPFFPNSGFDHPADNMLNVPVAAYSTGAAVRDIVRQQWLPRLHAHAPQLVLISAGFDAHREDDMAQMGLVEADYAWITDQLVEVADRHAQGRIVSTLEGGYNLSALGRSVVAHIRSLSKL
ncbi:histone deacetylase family protein [Bordetella hinzii]|nr:Histone deacetylase-like amidohydrolase [Bordetella hinzii]KCB21547.1 histone deacetylase family protein [Bordetella hinzii OH87 BAL007II]KCB32296.1 histone deacetylase family protein [Bordetella hinzii CA90 BAL1384]KCB32941.1 histone deacetylase family protein [Bordetella hinzii L60]KCB40439.1 histone deacetylase family protein [Bordetella hinzii 5132]KCB48864.1 histone deacetylase family protein [Bordetella hinzii 4161]KCB52539.1 histone deacetylase family protein [Bordetella hinzii 1277